MKHEATPGLATRAGPAALAARQETLLSATGISLTGPGAENAVRHLAIDALTSRRNRVVLSRSDARRLFGIDADTLREERIPGLALTDDSEHTRNLLARHASSQNVLVSCTDEVEEFRRSSAHHRGDLTIVTTSPGPGPSANISADGHVLLNTTSCPLPDWVPLLSTSGAFTQLMSMPTLACQPPASTVIHN
ncbi:hypothetical protein [Actinomadura sp. 9N215]|uniref:hypothetical protein n=1 Tax=Actinomadura sp. 9N215 TaxID=3375150 RepID=UPI0037AB09AC